MRADNILAELQSPSSKLLISSSALGVLHSCDISFYFHFNANIGRLNILAEESAHASQLLYWLLQVLWNNFFGAAR